MNDKEKAKERFVASGKGITVIHQKQPSIVFIDDEEDEEDEGEE